MKLLYSPGACSIGIHVLLAEIGAPYEIEAVNLQQPRDERPLSAINPKSKVPTLIRDDGAVLTEYPAIAYWLAGTYPAAKLFPADLEGQTRTLEALDFCVATLHMQGFGRLFGARRATNKQEADALSAMGRDIIARGFARMSATLGEQDWVIGAFSLADSALFYCSLWAGSFGVPLPGNIAAHLARMLARPAVASVLKAEGLA